MIHQNKNSWSLPKGHCDSGETMETTARREIKEESGVVALDLIAELGTYARHKLAVDGGDNKSELKEITMFLFLARSPLLGSMESKSRPIWMHKDTVGELLSHPKDKVFYASQWARVNAHSAPAIWQVTTTVNSIETAREIADTLVGQKLAACVQIMGPVESRYIWDGVPEIAQEWQVVAKCPGDGYAAVEAAILKGHSYNVPQITAVEVVAGLSGYLRWVEGSTRERYAIEPNLIP